MAIETETVSRAAFEATIQRLDSADLTNRILMDTHIAEYRREFGNLRTDMQGINLKLDTVIENQNKLKGRDGVVFFFVGAVISVSCTVIAASILGYIGW